MEDNESQPTNVLDMIATDASPAEITDTLKNMLYAKSVSYTHLTLPTIAKV